MTSEVGPNPRREPVVSGQRGLLDRARLLGLLDEGVTRQVTVICAPPGSGKTSLLRTWVEHMRDAYRIVFISPRSEDDEQGFWLSILAQLQHEHGTPTPVFNGATMVNRVLSELREEQVPTILIVDDAHTLGQDTLANLATLLSRLPLDVHAVISTRRDLRLGTHQLRIAGDLAEIRAEQLTFTESETRELLASSDITLSDEAVRTLQVRTEGWAAGLRLAVLSLASESDPETFVAQFSGSNRVVADYLMAEMLERQPLHVQQVLLATAILDRFNGELADLLSGTTGFRIECFTPELEEGQRLRRVGRQRTHLVSVSPSLPRTSAARTAAHAAVLDRRSAPARGRMVYGARTGR